MIRVPVTLSRLFEFLQRRGFGCDGVGGQRCHGKTVDGFLMPFGGVKESGFGRIGGKAGIAEFTELRWITMQTAPRHYPF